jgi:hypothetical protein
MTTVTEVPDLSLVDERERRNIEHAVRLGARWERYGQWYLSGGPVVGELELRDGITPMIAGRRRRCIPDYVSMAEALAVPWEVVERVCGALDPNDADGPR